MLRWTRVSLVALAAVPAAWLAGCGNSRTPVPGLTAPVSPAAVQLLSFPAYGIQIKAPRNWQNSFSRPPLVATISQSSSVAALWSYPRSTPAPSGAPALAAARARLIAAAQRRDTSFRLIRANVSLVDGYPAIELDAFERINGRPRRVRSTHVFTGTSEVVLDEYAPIALFHTVDHSVFSPLKRSLRLSSAAAG
jgi:hypothetical protein